MKKLLFLALVAPLFFTSCEKAILKETSVRIQTDGAAVKVDFTNDQEKHFANISDDEIRRLFKEEISNAIGKGKITVVGDGADADYVLNVHEINISEFVKTEYEDNQFFDISKVDVQTVYSLNQLREDLPTYSTIESTHEEALNDGKDKNKGGKKGNKGGSKSHGSKGGNAYIDGFGGINGAFNDHGTDLRKEVKKEMKSNQ
jgi:hypothetical protein